MKNDDLVLTGKKVILHSPRDENFSEFITLSRKNRQFHRGLVTPPTDRTGFDALLERNEAETDEIFLIRQRTDNALAGSIALSQIFRGKFQNAYLGYFLGQDFVGKGLMSEAIALVLKHAFKTLKLHRVEANVQPHNATSIAVLKRAGFSREGFSPKYLKIGGRWRDHERWAIIVENWRANKNGANNEK